MSWLNYFFRLFGIKDIFIKDFGIKKKGQQFKQMSLPAAPDDVKQNPAPTSTDKFQAIPRKTNLNTSTIPVIAARRTRALVPESNNAQKTRQVGPEPSFPNGFYGQAMSQATVIDLSKMLDLKEPEKLWAVIQVETNGAGFQDNRYPKMLYERHWFSRLTNRQFDHVAPTDISNPKPFHYDHPNPKQRYLTGQSNYDRLSCAMSYDRTAALKSASWGLGQVMGFNYAKAGYSNIDHMIQEMLLSEDAQLTAMANYIANNLDLIKALRKGQWAHFAKIYNGPNYKNHNYDVKLQNAYDSAKAAGLPDLKVRAAQLYLRYMGLKLTVDGELGVQTRAQIINYQKTHNLFQTGYIDNKLLAQLQKDIANLGKPDNWLI